jgi:hypothetical protein
VARNSSFPPLGNDASFCAFVITLSRGFRLQGTTSSLKARTSASGFFRNTAAATRAGDIDAAGHRRCAGALAGDGRLHGAGHIGADIHATVDCRHILVAISIASCNALRTAVGTDESAE